jgi:hypothetical protein
MPWWVVVVVVVYDGVGVSVDKTYGGERGKDKVAKLNLSDIYMRLRDKTREKKKRRLAMF